jgi:hypothetical protein
MAWAPRPLSIWSARRILWGGLLGLWLVVPAALSASSSQVVDVRVGSHPTYTRVVIELDEVAGYRLELDSNRGVLRVTVDAAADPVVLDSSSDLVESVEVEPTQGASIARVRLRQSNPRVRDRFFEDPPRIVLDLRSGEEAAPVSAVEPQPPIEAAPDARPVTEPAEMEKTAMEGSAENRPEAMPSDTASEAAEAPPGEPAPSGVVSEAAAPPAREPTPDPAATDPPLHLAAEPEPMPSLEVGSSRAAATQPRPKAEPTNPPSPSPHPRPDVSDVRAPSPGSAGGSLRPWPVGATAIIAAIVAFVVFVLARRRPGQLEAASEELLLAPPEMPSDPETTVASTSGPAEPREGPQSESLVADVLDAEDHTEPDDEDRHVPEQIPMPNSRARGPAEEERPPARAPKGATTMATMTRER